MTTPPNEPERPRSADLYEPAQSDPFSAFPEPAPERPATGSSRPIGVYEVPEPILPVAPHGESGAGVKIVAVLAVFALALGGLIFWLSTKDSMKFTSAPTPTKATTTTTRTTTPPPAPIAAPGDCVSMTGLMAQPDFKKVSCGEHNYTVTKVVTEPPPDEKCGTEADGYVQYKRIALAGRSVSVCLIPVFADGACYDLAFSMAKAAIPQKECGEVGTARVKVLADTVDKAACGPNPVLALAYPETKTTYCFSR
ncbi:hypothetical protein [Lentzea sp. NPDC051838]|uniref:LppU/SCO3897 family protein n=1 Tax=Lentzea sp. NPDC051838 TaxID=3154849 RepID=UPI0034429613